MGQISKGIVLAGGAGTRLYPVTLVASKQLQPVYDKPMIYYPLTTLMLGGVRDICIISTLADIPRYQQLLGNGDQWGINLSYRVQPEPNGIAQAFLIARDFIEDDSVALILGDNLFYGNMELSSSFGSFDGGGRVFAYPVTDPERYGVVEFDGDGRVTGLEEKPKNPRSHYAIPGLYLYDNEVVEICEGLQPSDRGELEITDVNLEYLRRDRLSVSVLGRGVAWLDTGTSASFQEASNFVAILERRTGRKVGCPEEAALEMGFICHYDFKQLIGQMPECEYSDYLKEVSREFAGRQNPVFAG